MEPVSLVVVSYGSSSVLAAALTSFRAEAARTGLVPEAVVVDHSSDASEWARLKALEPETLLRRDNRGYAAGLNAGVAVARAERLLLANPDLEFLPGSLSALLVGLEQGWAIVGPQFVLGEALFPPAEEQSPRNELRRIAARRSPRSWQRYMRWHARAALRQWSSREPQHTSTLSGALIATTRTTFDRVGPWDEDYFLYFEEVDWLRRAGSEGLEVALVPTSRVCHAWGHAARPDEHGATFERSRQRFYRRHFPGWQPPVLSPATPPDWPALPPASELEPLGELWWLVSPSPWGFPAAGLGRLTAAGLEPALARFTAARSHGGALVVSAYCPERDLLLGGFQVEG